MPFRLPLCSSLSALSAPSTLIFYPNYTDVQRISSAASLAVPIGKRLTVNGGYGMQHLNGEALDIGSPVFDEEDAFHQIIALNAAAGWLSGSAIDEWLERRRSAPARTGGPGRSTPCRSSPSAPGSAA